MESDRFRPVSYFIPVRNIKLQWRCIACGQWNTGEWTNKAYCSRCNSRLNSNTQPGTITGENENGI